ncbi:ParB/RepB/Spo0J family partition protein [Desulfopila inferna]|uniref:ParB/RepB/Spo0J family partition protein n=1 Tax=Desulfopila inferna TaxID=468528 RepID=UPI001964024B|nr:ParB/RepB/Spo0J family partition protein [Desulfopila inferna]MBM9604237.1 ParB/RepB/Spo0J family partition protein [Desulfopila inferna]
MNVYDKIAITQIHDSGIYNIHPFLQDAPASKDLTASIKTSGLLSPPVLLQQRQEAKFDVICGRQRLKCVVSELGASECCCRILPEQTSPEQILSIIIEDQYSRGSLSIIEQAHFISLCQRLLPARKQREKFISNLPHGRISKGTQFLLPLISFPEQIQKQSHYGVISDKIIRDLQLLIEHDQLQFLELVEKLQISGNNQKKVLHQLIDIVKKEDIALESLLNRKEIVELLDNTEISTQQKSSRFFEQISRMSLPLLSAAQENFAQEVKELKLPENCSIIPSRSFETDEVVLAIRYRNLQDAKESWKELRHCLNTAD